MENRLFEMRREFRNWQKCFPDEVVALPGSGSDRLYYRIILSGESYIGAYNENVQENLAFFEMTKHFSSHKVPVPELYFMSDDKHTYFLQDLGTTVLFDLLDKDREEGAVSEEILAYYRQALKELAHLQAVAGKDLDYSCTYPVASFDRQSVMWDLNYFKYYYAKLMGIECDELALQRDFEALADLLMEAPSDYFMFRDFQSRNIMIHNGKVFFIDYQGGRQGAPQYDVASLLWQARAQLPADIKAGLLKTYLEALKEYRDVDEKEFLKHYNAFVLIRVLQTLGAYGFRGLYEHKTHFVLSLPMAVENLKQIVFQMEFLSDFPVLFRLLKSLLMRKYQPWIAQIPEKDKLNIFIESFSYRKGLPANYTGHGGGHVFDCRAIHNPGRYQEYKKLTGRDQPVIDFLDKTKEMQEFLDAVKVIADMSVQKYLNRGFEHLSLHFGCTGGQHRSVYAAEKIFAYLKNKYPVRLVLTHREQNISVTDYGEENVR